MPNPKSRANEILSRTRHRFFLNPYADMACTKCPICEAKTKQRKVPLMIHIVPDQPLMLNKTCRYCERCDLLIARQAEIEPLMAAAFETRRPEVIGHAYQVVGTMDRKDWRECSGAPSPPADVFDRVYVFKDVLHFDYDPGGWGPA